MQPFIALIRSQSNGLVHGIRGFHSTGSLQKFITDTELIHKGVKYGRKEYPTVPNDPRVPSNPEFGVTLLEKRFEILEPIEPKRKISKAMQVYLERAAKHNEFMSEQEKEFDLGKRHLANIMGVDPLKMSQNDIDTAIRYLMPSGLFDPRARPRMRPPKEIYPAIKDAQFQPDGRPFSTFFYTGKANFYEACYELESEFLKLKDYQNADEKLGIFRPQKEAKLDLLTSTWITRKEMNQMFLERINEPRYESFIAGLEALANHPYSARSEEFIMKYRIPLKTAMETMVVEPMKYDENGRGYATGEGRRKHCIAQVTVRENGTGKVDINGKDILYFQHIQDREQVMTPINFVDLLGKVDIECKTMYEEESREWSEDAPAFPPNKEKRMLGISAQSGAIRYALSLALKSFVDRETIEKMRRVGLLTPDYRQKERKKWGQEGARRKYTWKKR